MRDTKDNDRRADSLLLRWRRSFIVCLFLLLLLRGRLALVRILRENGGCANEQRQTKQYAHQFLHSGLLKCLGNCA